MTEIRPTATKQMSRRKAGKVLREMICDESRMAGVSTEIEHLLAILSQELSKSSTTENEDK